MTYSTFKETTGLPGFYFQQHHPYKVQFSITLVIRWSLVDVSFLPW